MNQGRIKIAQLQIKVSADKSENLRRAAALIEELMPERPDLICLGEMFSCPYETPLFPRYAEPEGGESWQVLSALARRYGVYLSAGSIPEADEKNRIFNTAYVFDREGRQIGKHRKMHLFDVAITGGQVTRESGALPADGQISREPGALPAGGQSSREPGALPAGGQFFRESDTLSAGGAVTVFDTEFGKIGLCICFDLRFPELARLMVLNGAEIILVPAAFNTTTGPAHWELLFRCRAVDNQCYIIGTSPARDAGASYRAWGHSLVVSPWGTVLSEMDEREGVQITEIDPAEVQRARLELPLLSARREDVYELLSFTAPPAAPPSESSAGGPDPG